MAGALSAAQMIGLIVVGVLAQSAPPLVPADGLTPEDPQPPPGATGEFTRRSNGTVCFVVVDEQGERSHLCRSAFGDYPLPLSDSKAGNPIPKVRPRPISTPPPEPPGPEDLRDDAPSPTRGRFGVVAVAAGSASLALAPGGSVEGGGTAGIGLRYGLRERDRYYRMLMPALALVVGSGFTAAGAAPYLELRGELMSVSPGGPLQPNFVVYAGTGGSTSPLGSGGPFSIQPHLGFGIGWNWLPGGGGSWGGGWGSFGSGGGGYGLIILAGIIVAAVAIVGFVMAGRVEVRYTARPLSGSGSDFVSVMAGFGF